MNKDRVAPVPQRTANEEGTPCSLPLFDRLKAVWLAKPPCDRSPLRLFKKTALDHVKYIRRDPETPYMERYFLQEDGRQYAYLHRFVRPDGDQFVHSHPWAVAKSLVLCGGYQEVRYDGAAAVEVKLSAGDENTIVQSTLHRIVSVEPETWTLFVHSDWISDWGFATDWVDGRPTIERRQRTPDGEGRYWWRKELTLNHLLQREPYIARDGA